MFKKEVSIHSHSLLKGSDIKKISQDIVNAFPGIDEDVIPSKKKKNDVGIGKSRLTNGVDIIMYGSEPMFFLSGRDYVPSENGADLMLPGVLYPHDGSGYPDVHKNKLVGIALGDSKIPVAVGYAEFEGAAQPRKGKACTVLHHFGDTDHLYLLGSRSKPPNDLEQSETVPEPSGSEQVADASGVDGSVVNVDAETVTQAISDVKIDNEAAPVGVTDNVVNENEDEKANDEDDGNDDDDDDTAQTSRSRSKRKTNQPHPNVQAAPIVLQDDVFEQVFVLACTVDTVELPVCCGFFCVHCQILVSSFFTSVMQPIAKNDTSIPDLNIKHTSYKKLSKLVKVMVTKDYVTAKDVVGGDVQILAINRQRCVDVAREHSWYLRKAKRDDDGDDDDGPNYASSVLYKVRGDQFPLIHEAWLIFKNNAGDDDIPEIVKGEVYSKRIILKLLWSYCAYKGLVQGHGDKVSVDEPIRKSLSTKATLTEISKKELVTRLFDAMPLYTVVTCNDGRNRIVPGDAKLSIRTEKRDGNRLVTIMTGVEIFDFDLAVLAQDLRKKFSCSCSVSDDSSNKFKEIKIQGNVPDQLMDHLFEVYGVPRKFLVVCNMSLNIMQQVTKRAK